MNIGNTQNSDSGDSDHENRFLVLKAQHGDVKSFRRLYETHLAPVYSLCCHIANDSRTAERLTKRIFIHVWEVLAEADAESDFNSWLSSRSQGVILDHQNTGQGEGDHSNETLRHEVEHHCIEYFFRDEFADEPTELVEPDRNLWPEIQGHIETEGIAPNDREQKKRKTGFLYVVGALVMFVIIGIAVSSTDEPPEPVEPVTESPGSAPEDTVSPEQNGRLALLQDEYAQLKTELDGIVEVDDDDENAEVKKSIEENMGIVEKSISEIIGAMGDEPENEVLEKMLVSTYKRQLKLMKTFLLLGDDDDE